MKLVVFVPGKENRQVMIGSVTLGYHQGGMRIMVHDTRKYKDFEVAYHLPLHPGSAVTVKNTVVFVEAESEADLNPRLDDLFAP